MVYHLVNMLTNNTQSSDQNQGVFYLFLRLRFLIMAHLFWWLDNLR